MAWTVQHEVIRVEADLGLRLVGALWWFWFIGGHFREGRQWLEQLLAASEGASPSLRARALLGWGVLTFMLGDFQGATVPLEESLRLSRAADDRLGVAWTIEMLGVREMYVGDNARAMVHFQESLALWRQLRNTWGVASMAQSVGNMLAAQGETQRAGLLFKESLALCREVGDKHATALTLHNSANLAIAQGDIEGATPLVEESLSMFRELRDRRSIPRALGNLGQIACARGDYDRAAAVFREGLTLFREIGDKRGSPCALSGWGAWGVAKGVGSRPFDFLGRPTPSARPSVLSRLRPVLQSTSLAEVATGLSFESQATVLAHLGVAPQIIQRRLGHSKIGTTMDIYAHEMPNEDVGAAVMLDQIFGKDKKTEPPGSSR